MSTGLHRIRRSTGERGAALVEMALVLPLIMMLLLGIITGGNAYQRKITIVDAVREGTRYGATLSVGTEVSPYPIWTAAVVNRIVELSGGILTASDVCVTLDAPASPPDTPCGVADPATPGPEHLVKVSATKTATLNWFFVSRTLTLQGKSVARFERESS